MLALIPLIAGPSVAVGAIPRDAKDIVAADCVTCHGMDGGGPVPTFPKLAGMQPEYLDKQLVEFTNGTRQSEVMGFISGKYQRSELFALANYFGNQPRLPGKVSDRALAEQGRVVFQEGNKDSGVPACAGCHRPDGLGTPRSPMLAGQNPAYTLQQLRNFEHDVRTNDRGRLMRTVAGRMTDEEMRAVSEYIAGMPVSPGQP